MDIKATIGELVEKITKDASLKEKFGKDPVGTVKELVGNLPKDQLEAIVEGIKAKIDIDKIGGKLGGVLGGLFGKK